MSTRGSPGNLHLGYVFSPVLVLLLLLLLSCCCVSPLSSHPTVPPTSRPPSATTTPLDPLSPYWTHLYMAVEVVNPFDRSKRDTQQLFNSHINKHIIALQNTLGLYLFISPENREVFARKSHVTDRRSNLGRRDDSHFTIYEIFKRANNSVEEMENGGSKTCIIKRHNSRILVCMDHTGRVMTEEATATTFSFTENCIWNFEITSQGVMFYRNVGHSQYYLGASPLYRQFMNGAHTKPQTPEVIWRVQEVTNSLEHRGPQESPTSPQTAFSDRIHSANLTAVLRPQNSSFFHDHMQEIQRNECRTLRRTLLSMAVRDALAYSRIWSDFDLLLMELEAKAPTSVPFLKEWFFNQHRLPLALKCKARGKKKGRMCAKILSTKPEVRQSISRQIDVVLSLESLVRLTPTSKLALLNNPDVYAFLSEKLHYSLPNQQRLIEAAVFADFYLGTRELAEGMNSHALPSLCEELGHKWMRLKLENVVLSKDSSSLFTLGTVSERAVNEARTLEHRLEMTQCLRNIHRETVTPSNNSEDCAAIVFQS